MGKVMDFTVTLSMLTSGNFTTTVGPAAENMRKLSQQVQNLQRVSGNITGFQKQTQKLEVLRQKLSQAQAKVKEFQTRKRQGEIIDPKAFTRANEEAARLQKLVQENTRTLGTFRTELKAAGVDTKDLAGAQAQLQAQTERAKAAQEKLVSAQKRFADIKGQLRWGNIQADVMKSAMFLKAFTQPIQVNMNFEQAMAQVRAVKTMTDEEFTRLETQAKELGASTQYSATQAANTQENLARAGMSITDITAALPAVLSMAGAEGMDLAQAGSIIAKGLGGMGLSGDLAPRLADILAYTSSSANTNIAEIGEAFKVAAPIFSSQGATMEQLASYIGVLANKGYTGSEAGNAISAAPLRLAKQSKETKDTLAKLGVAVQTRDGRLRELPDIMKALDQAMKARNYGEVQQLEAVETIFGKNYGKAMMAFMQASAAGDTERMQSGVYIDSFGKAAEMNAARNDTLKGDLTSLSSAWEGLMIRIGKPLGFINRFLTQTLTTVIQDITKFMNSYDWFFDLVIDACYAIGGIKVASTVYKYFSLGIEFLSSWRAVKIAEKGAELASAAANAGTLAANMSSAGNAAGLFGMSLKSALGWVSLIALACYEIYQHWEDITAAAQRAGEAISSIDPSKASAAKAGTLSRSDSDYGAAVMTSTYMPPEIKNAKGGIYSSPIWTWAAEKGPEAIIPLTDKSRGIPLVMKAAQMLGMTQNYSTLPQNQILNSASSISPIKTINENTSLSTLSQTGNVITQGNILTQERQMINNVSQISNDTLNGNNAVGAAGMTFTPTYNITVNGEGQSGIGDSIRQVIEDTMNELMSRMERVSFA